MKVSRFDIAHGKTAGVLLATCAVLTMVAVSHHPTVHAVRAQDAITGLARISLMDGVVHGSLVVMMGALLFALTVYSGQRGFRNQFVLAALPIYATAIFAVTGAALIDGFLIPQFASRYVGEAAETLRAVVPLIHFCAIAIQVLTKFGFAVMSVAVVLWSTDLLFLRGAPRLVGAIGIASSLISALLIATSGYINPHSLGIIVAVQAIWYLGVATLLIKANLPVDHDN
ncbi:MAG: hypothetical protein M3N19_02915 [Candidatus Eremiobacteraeota bacterium]|nr:hypothetical protein [Candidatus Eremiobacteraeota bacterium]